MNIPIHLEIHLHLSIDSATGTTQVRVAPQEQVVTPNCDAVENLLKPTGQMAKGKNLSDQLPASYLRLV